MRICSHSREKDSCRKYLDLLEGLYLVRSIPAWSRNAGKRLVKAPKVFWRDSGFLHTLTGLLDLEQVLGHPLCSHSWEDYCIEQIVTRLPQGPTFSHYRSHAGAEVDLVQENPSGETVALEIRRTFSPKRSPGFGGSMKTLQATKRYYIIPQGNIPTCRIRDRYQSGGFPAQHLQNPAFDVK